MNLKKAVSFLTGLMTATLCIPTSFSVFADDDDIISSGDYEYSLNDDGEACLETYIGTDAEVIIPSEIDGNPVTSLGDTFLNTDVESITLSDTISKVGNNAFVECLSLKEINVPEDNKKFASEDGVLFTSDMTFVVCYPSGKEGDTYEIPEGITDIGIAAFYSTQLQSIKYPSTLEYIDRHAISYNENMTEVDLSNTSVSEIGDMAFAGDTALTVVKFPDSLYCIDGGAFALCTSLTEVTLPEYLSIIEQNAFAGTGLEEITIPESVEEIGYCAFGYDENLEIIEDFIIRGVSGSMAETYATDSDDEYDYYNTFTFISTDSSEYEQLESIEYGDFEYAEQDGEAYITYCDQSLTDVEIPSEINGLPVTVIYGAAFYQSEVETLKLPDTLKRIELMAFSYCENLKSVEIPEGVEEVMAQAFYYCSSLEEVSIPSTCTTIGDNAFSACSNLSAINVADGNEVYQSIDGILFNSDGTELVKYPDGKGAVYKVPSNVKIISNYAFSENAVLTEVDTNNVETIGVDAFSFCDSLQKVKMGNSVTSIGDYAFYECKLLEEINFSKSLEVVGDYVFYDCPLITKIRLYDALTSIGECAFGYVFDESSSSTQSVDNFTIYADEDTGGAGYAENCGFDVISGTVALGSLNIDRVFLIVVGSLCGVVIVAGVISVAVKSKKKKQQSELEG